MSSWMLTEAYSSGPPLTEHPEICESMSPVKGHYAEPQTSPPPFDIRVMTTSNCYKVAEAIAGRPMRE